MNDTLNTNILRIIQASRPVTFDALVGLGSPQLTGLIDPGAHWWERNHGKSDPGGMLGSCQTRLF